MKAGKVQIGKQFTRASFDVSTINKENRTVDVVFATETPVLRRTWDGPINEILVCDAASVRMERINAGAPLLDTHDKYSVTTQLGVVENARIDGRTLRATVRFSKRDDVEKVWQDVMDGILRNVSVGYWTYEAEITEKIDSAIPDYRATDWEPFEISLVPVPADMNAGVRSYENEETRELKITKKNTNMKIAAQILAAVRAAGLSSEFAETLLNDENITMERAQPLIDAEKTRVATIPAQAPAPAPAPAPADSRMASDILHAVRSAGIENGLEFAQGLINTAGMTIESARAAIIDKLAERQAPAPRNANPLTIVPGKDEVDKKRSGLENAILFRAAPGTVKDTDAAEFRGMSLLRMAEECIKMAGGNVKGMSQREIAQNALNIGERQHSTSDFPLILGNTINRTLRTAYQLAERTFTPWCVQGTAKDFREMSRTQLSDFSSLDEIKEGAEYKMGTIGEGAEKYKVVKYGKKIAITWETLINDDLDAFGRLPQAMAASAAQKQSDIVYGILTANAVLSDNVALFHATHGNLTGTGTALDITSLGVARALFRKQKAPKGGVMNLTPKFLIVSPDLETTALQITSQAYVPATQGTINPWAGILTPIVDARLTGNAWYLAANPSIVDTIEYSFLNGEELFTEQRNGFDVDGLEMKVRMVFGAKAIDFRGLYKNNGA